MRVKRFVPDRGAKPVYRNEAEIERERQRELVREPGGVVRITLISDACEYRKLSRYLVGKLMRPVKIERGTTGWYAFVNDADRLAMNKAAGWSDRKDRYYLQNPRLQ